MELSCLTTIILFLSHVSYGICLIAFRQQWVGVKGKLICNNKPLEGAVVRLWDKNLVGKEYFRSEILYLILGPDILLGETKSDKNGVYEAIGGLQSVFPLNVHLRISHECDDRMIVRFSRITNVSKLSTIDYWLNFSRAWEQLIWMFHRNMWVEVLSWRLGWMQARWTWLSATRTKPEFAIRTLSFHRKYRVYRLLKCN